MSDDSATGRTGGVDTNLARHGKISYIRIPAEDAAIAAGFYRDVFAWAINDDNPHHRSFADASGDLIGAFVTNRAVSSTPGVLPYVYVEGIDAVIGKITERGGEIVEQPYAEGGLWVATFRDPAGNVMGLWQQGPR